MARVVVLMPVYNAGCFLHRAIKSILGQSFKDFQLMIIDDASTDNSLEIIESFADPRIYCHRNDSNMGLARTLNRGMALADCEYLVRMDADDISLPRRLEWQVAFMDSDRDIGASGSWIKGFGSLASRGVIKYVSGHESMRACLLFCTSMAHPTVILRHAEWMSEKLSYNPTFNRTEDFELWSRAVSKIRFGNLPKVTCLYRRHSGSVTLYHSDEMISQYQIIIKGHLEKIGIIPSSHEVELHSKIGLREKVGSITELRTAEEWLKYVRRLAVQAGYEKVSVKEAFSLIWYRYSRNAAWLGREGERMCLSSDLLMPESVTYKDRALFKAAVLFHSCKVRFQ